MTDCLIIGGGLLGMLSARELARAGAKVTLLERGEVGREASWAGGGILSPLHPWQAPDSVTALAQWSQQYYPQLAQDLLDKTGIDPEFTQSGLLILADHEDVGAEAWAASTHTRLERINSGDLARYEPALAGCAERAWWLPQVAQIRSPRLLQALQQDLLQKGVEIKEHTEVIGIQAQAGRVTGVETVQGRLTADQVVVAGGAWSGKLLHGLGYDLPIVPVAGQMILFQACPGMLSRIVVKQDRYLIPRRDGRIVVGSTVEQTGFEKITTEEALRDLQQAALALLPGLADYRVEHHWAGLRPGAPQGVPFIGPHPMIRGLYINTGHFRNGLTLAPASARLLADRMSGAPPVIDPEPYRLDRLSQ
ncbi:MAG TPA: glycine oxidase ThiO [Gammaproteobacteria bacterium]|nr:glycine oxidase ThiO [Gammaproteobacteria bacterium]